MTMDRSLVRISKFVSKVLRHAPESVGLRLDEAGWVDVADLLAAANRAGVALDRPTLERVVADNDKQRFALSDDGLRIRASQGHSVEVELGYEPAEPPEVLYHGTAERFLEGIGREGLKRGARHDVHLSGDAETARRVGGRRGPPVVLRVRAGLMHRDGHEFRRSANGVWLTGHVPPEYIIYDGSERDAAAG